MVDTVHKGIPKEYNALMGKSKELGFTMPSDLHVGSLLQTLVASKPNGHILELGTGIGLSLSWMLQGMDATSSLISIDNDPLLTETVLGVFGERDNLSLVCGDASTWLKAYKGPKFDLIFADAWPGKYSDLDLALGLIKVGGFYVVDDMAQQPNWPLGHQDHVDAFLALMEERTDFYIAKLDWSTGIMIGTKKKE